ncbi:hypothetical protein ACTFIZ_002076 [Dictyostelium cf. discoideum]
MDSVSWGTKDFISDEFSGAKDNTVLLITAVMESYFEGQILENYPKSNSITLYLNLGAILNFLVAQFNLGTILIHVSRFNVDRNEKAGIYWLDKHPLISSIILTQHWI